VHTVSQPENKLNFHRSKSVNIILESTIPTCT